MSGPMSGAIIGAILGFAALTFGFWGFLLVGILMLIGAALARIISGDIDVKALASVFTGRRSSS